MSERENIIVSDMKLRLKRFIMETDDDMNPVADEVASLLQQRNELHHVSIIVGMDE